MSTLLPCKAKSITDGEKVAAASTVNLIKRDEGLLLHQPPGTNTGGRSQTFPLGAFVSRKVTFVRLVDSKINQEVDVDTSGAYSRHTVRAT